MLMNLEENQTLTISSQLLNIINYGNKTINLAIIFNIIITFFIIIIIIVSSVKMGFNGYFHSLLIQIVILNITFIITVKKTIDYITINIIRNINVRTQVNTSYNELYNYI